MRYVIWMNVVCSILSVPLLAENPVIIDGPDPVNAVEGTKVQFSCVIHFSGVADTMDEVDFFVNETATNKLNIYQAGFIESTVDNLNATTQRLNLTATALSQYNNTEVLCRGINTVGLMTFAVFSEVAVLLVQGKLSSVGDISYYFIDCSSLNISWNPPFTLPGTHITGYNISVTSIMFDISQFITNTYYVLTATNNTDPCDEISITVSGYNGAGNGKMTTISSLYFPKATYDTQSIDITSTNGEVCVVCTFSINTTAFGCEIQLRNNIVALTERFNRDVNIAEGCLSNIISGYYDLYVYDVENDHKLSVLPAIIKNQVFVDAKRTTTSITTTISTATFLKDSFSYSVPLLLSSSISLTITSTVSFPTVTRDENIVDTNTETNTTVIIATSMSVAMLLLIIVIIVLVMVIIHSRIYKHLDPIQISLVYNDSRVGTNTNSNERFPVISNPAYEDTHPLQANTPIYENVQAINYPTL